MGLNSTNMESTHHYFFKISTGTLKASLYFVILQIRTPDIGVVRGLKFHINYLTSPMAPWRSYSVDNGLRRNPTHAGRRDFAVDLWLSQESDEVLPCSTLRGLDHTRRPFQTTHLSSDFLMCTLALCAFWVLQEGKKQLLLDGALCNSRKSRRTLLSF